MVAQKSKALSSSPSHDIFATRDLIRSKNRTNKEQSDHIEEFDMTEHCCIFKESNSVESERTEISYYSSHSIHGNDNNSNDAVRCVEHDCDNGDNDGGKHDDYVRKLDRRDVNKSSCSLTSAFTLENLGFTDEVSELDLDDLEYEIEYEIEYEPCDDLDPEMETEAAALQATSSLNEVEAQNASPTGKSRVSSEESPNNDNADEICLRNASPSIRHIAERLRQSLHNNKSSTGKLKRQGSGRSRAWNFFYTEDHPELDPVTARKFLQQLEIHIETQKRTYQHSRHSMNRLTDASQSNDTNNVDDNNTVDVTSHQYPDSTLFDEEDDEDDDDDNEDYAEETVVEELYEQSVFEEETIIEEGTIFEEIIEEEIS